MWLYLKFWCPSSVSFKVRNQCQWTLQDGVMLDFEFSKYGHPYNTSAHWMLDCGQYQAGGKCLSHQRTGHGVGGGGLCCPTLQWCGRWWWRGCRQDCGTHRTPGCTDGPRPRSGWAAEGNCRRTASQWTACPSPGPWSPWKSKRAVERTVYEGYRSCVYVHVFHKILYLLHI